MVQVDGFPNGSFVQSSHSIGLEKEPIKYQVDLSKNTFNLNQNAPAIKSRNVVQVFFSKVYEFFLNVVSFGEHQARLDQQAFAKAVKEDDRQEMERLLEKSSVRVMDQDLFYLYDQNKWSFEPLLYYPYYTTNSTNFMSKIFASFEREPTSQKFTRLLSIRPLVADKTNMIKIREIFIKDNFKNFTKEDFELFLNQLGNAYNYKNKEFIQDFFKEFIKRKQYKFIEMSLNNTGIGHLLSPLIEYMLLTPGLDRSEILETLKSVNRNYFHRDAESILLSEEFNQLEEAEQKQIFMFFKDKKMLSPILIKYGSYYLKTGSETT